MPYDNFLADRLDWIMDENKQSYSVRNMFGGRAYMVNDKMCFGIVGEKLMARVGTEYYEEALMQKGCIPMDFTGRPMKGYVFVEPEGISTDQELAFWIKKCLEFNPLAKSSIKKRKE